MTDGFLEQDVPQVPAGPEMGYDSWHSKFCTILCSLYADGFPVSNFGKWSKTANMYRYRLNGEDLRRHIGGILENAGINPKAFFAGPGPVRKNDRDFVRACALLLNEYTAYYFPGTPNADDMGDWGFEGTRCRVARKNATGVIESPVTAIYMDVAVSDYYKTNGGGFEVMYYDRDMHFIFFNSSDQDMVCQLTGSWQLRSTLSGSFGLTDPVDDDTVEQRGSFSQPITVEMKGGRSVHTIPVLPDFDTGYLRSWGNDKYDTVKAQQKISTTYEDFEVLLTPESFPDPKYKYWDLQF